jgi:hypothetical protein
MTRVFKIILVALLLSGIARAQSDSPGPQPKAPAIEPLHIPGRDPQLYIGFLQTRYDYSLRTPAAAASASRLTNNGGSLEYEFRQWGKFSLLTTFRYGSGGPLQQSLSTAAVGGRYGFTFKHFEPFAQLLGGYSRLTSNHAAGNMFLGSGVNNSFTTLLGSGVDVTVSRHWGIRPFYIENQYLPMVGRQRSLYWSVGAGVLFRFHRGP